MHVRLQYLCTLCGNASGPAHVHPHRHARTHRHTHGSCKETMQTQEWAVAQAWVLKRMLGYIRTVLKKE